MKVEGGDQQDRVLGTTHALVQKFADRIGVPIITGSAVRVLNFRDGQVIAKTDKSTVQARYAIVATSPCHRSTISFEPPLPEQHYGLSRSWRLGALSKAFVAYDQPFWRSEGLSGEAVSDDDVVFLTFDVTPDSSGPGILMVFCNASGFDKLDVLDRKSRVVEHLVHLYGEQARTITDYTDFSWGNDTFAPGGPNPALGPSSWTSFGRYLREPVGPVYWAGTETADEFSGTMNGAVLSGQRAAREVIALLSATSAD